jgi:hypothetical protein
MAISLAFDTAIARVLPKSVAKARASVRAGGNNRVPSISVGDRKIAI